MRACASRSPYLQPLLFTTIYTYDGFNRLTRTTFPDLSYEQLGLDENGNVTSRRNRANQTLSYSYNALDWNTQKVSPSPAVTTAWTYLLDGRIDTLTDNAGTGNTIDYSYDTAGRLSQVATKIPGISNKTVKYELDANGNRTKLTWPGSPTYYVGYCYDTLNRMAKALENATDCNSSTGLLASYTYNPLSRRTNLTYGTGAQVQTPDPTSYSAAGDLLSLAHVFQGGTSNDNTFTYGYTPAHQTGSIDASNTAWLWRPSATSTTGYTVNNLNQYTAVAGTTQSYDQKGNLTGDGTTTFTYDAENRLLTASKTGLAATYAYDPLGRRTKKTGTGVTETYYLSDGTDEIAEYDTTSNVINRFVPGRAVDQPIAQVTGAGTKTYFHADKQGSVVAMSDSTGAMAEGPYIYDAYGNCTSGGSACTVSATTSPYRFTGRRLDPETGFYYYRARYYDPKTGRFTQTDPVEYEADLNLYTYVGNDPTDAADPTGMCEGSRIDAAPGSVCSGTNKDPNFNGSAAQKAIENARRRGIDRAWAAEKQLVASGRPGTVNWTPKQKAELLKTGRVAGYVGHHINTVNGNPIELAENPNNIQIMTRAEHAALHAEEGGTRVPITGRPLLNRTLGIVGIIPVITHMLTHPPRKDDPVGSVMDLFGVTEQDLMVRGDDSPT